MQAELLCPLCGVNYSEDRLPRILAVCGHSFCEPCIEQRIIQDGQGKFYLCCPEDNMRCQINTKDVKQVPINRSLLKIAESAKVKTPHKDSSFELSKTTKEEELQEDMEIHQFKNPDHISPFEQSSNTKTHFQCTELQLKEQNQFLDEENMCLLHQKPLEIVCVYDLQKVCAKCAIFGEHKGHDFKSLEEIEEEKQQYCQQLEAVFGLKKEIMNRIQNKTTKSDIISILNEKNSNLSKQIKQKFKSLIDALKAQQAKILAKLNQMNRKFQKEIDNLYKIDTALIQKYEDWEKVAKLKLEQINKGTFEQQLKLLIKVESVKQKNSLSQGQSLVDSILTQEQNIITNSQALLSSLNLKVNDKIFELIPSFVDVLDKPEKISLPIVFDSIVDYSPNSGSNQINLLEIEGSHDEIILPQKVTFTESPIGSVREIEIKPEQVKIVPFIEGKVFDEKPSIKPHQRKTSTKRQFPREKMKTEASQQSFIYTSRETSFTSEKSIRLKKKVKKIKVPQKYEKILEALSSDTLDTLDLTNAELGDSVMLQICEILRGSKVKTAKLIRNKLSDEGLTKMLPFMEHLVTLNLSQNLLTEKILGVLIKCRDMIPKVKNIVLSMNKIVERKDKKKIDQLRVLGITVSV